MTLYNAQLNDGEVNCGDKQKTERVIGLSCMHGGIHVDIEDNWSQTTVHNGFLRVYLNFYPYVFIKRN